MRSDARPSARFRAVEGEAFAALAASGFGSAYVATAIALRSFGPVEVAAWRGFLATLALWAVVLVRARLAGRTTAARPAARTVADAPPGAAPGPAARLLRIGILAVLGGPVFLSAMNLSISNVGPTIASFVAGLYAILTALLGPLLLRERLTVRVVAAFVVALVGTALLAELDLVGRGAIGLAWGLTAAVSYALYLVLTRRWSARYGLDGLVIAACMTAATALVLGGPRLLVDPATLFPAGVTGDALVALAWLAVVAGGGTVLVLASVRLIPAARSAAFLLLNPVTATVLSAVLLGTRPAPVQLVGGLLVLGGIAAATMPTARGPGPGVDPSGQSAG